MTAQTYPLDRSALLLIDVLNEFLAEDGKLHPPMQGMLAELQLVPQLEKLLAGVRRAGLRVIYAPHGLNEHSFKGWKHLHPRMQLGFENRAFWHGSSGADFYPSLRPTADDVVVSRHQTFNSFIGTNLDATLRQHGVEHLILAGLTSHTCVEGTGRHALEAGYHVTFLVDAVADFTLAAHRAAVEVAYPTFGHAALTVDAFLAALAHDVSEIQG